MSTPTDPNTNVARWLDSLDPLAWLAIVTFPRFVRVCRVTPKRRSG